MTITVALAAIAVLAAAGAVARVFGRRTSGRSTRGWTPRRRTALAPTRPWRASAPMAITSPPPWRWEATAIGAMAVAAVAAVVGIGFALWPSEPPQPAAVLVVPTTSPDDALGLDEIRFAVDPGLVAAPGASNRIPAAVADDEWFTVEAEHRDAQGWAFDPNSNLRQANHYQLMDFRSRYLNVIGGNRVSWTPPPCDCTRLTVWIFGGSTTYGLDQRDEHTIASELARVAHEHGIAIDILNKGRNGHLHWLEAERFAWDLTLDDPPDLAVFYDGVNDEWATSAFNPPRSPAINPTLDGLWESTGRSELAPPDPPEGARFVGRAAEHMGTPSQQAHRTITNYERSRWLSRAVGDAHDVPVRYFWQPSRYTKPLDLDEPHGAGAEENDRRHVAQLQSKYLPRDVIDVSDALVDVTGPVFTDDVHHNERAARIIAEAMFTELETDLRQLVAAKAAAR